MPSDNLWKELITTEALTRGWHLARLDSKQDFAEDLYSTDVYASSLKLNIKESINRLVTETYQPRQLLRMEVPKGSLGFRPGAVIPIQDRVIVSTIISLIAPVLDKKLPDSVYSWRVKHPLPKKGSIFKETDITDIPYLKKKTIKIEIDPFESWYEVWPEFDEVSRNAFLENGYLYMATTDIAAYFENIQLPILRDQFLGYFSDDTKIINLLFTFLESWAHRTPDGRTHLRGIPQGNFISSFLGNIFLLPLDEEFTRFQKKHDVLYYRYMDDARIFTKHIADARRSIFTMDRTLRTLHLNVQTAKTKIFDESRGEISKALIDERVDELSEIIDQLKPINVRKMKSREKTNYLNKLNVIAHKECEGQQKILGSRRPLEGLTARAFQRWIYAHKLLFSDKYIKRLLNEIQYNPDYKLTKKLVSTSKAFPRHSGIEKYLLNFIDSNKNIFEHQEAECIRVIRYLSVLHKGTISHCKKRLRNTKIPPYLRMQSAYLLSRTELNERYLVMMNKLFLAEMNPYVQAALSMILVQKRKNNDSIIQQLVYHPNEKIRELGNFYYHVKNDKLIARNQLNHIFRDELPWLICDNMPLVHLMSMSDNKAIRQALLDAIRKPRLKHPIGDIRSILKTVFTRTRKSLISCR